MFTLTSNIPIYEFICIWYVKGIKKSFRVVN